MNTLKVIGGDWPAGDGLFQVTAGPGYSFAYFHMPQTREPVKATDLVGVELASQETVKRFWPAVGLGVGGAVVLGPVGLLAGLLAGGKRTESTFIAKFKDGRAVVATTDPKTFAIIKAFAARPAAPSPDESENEKIARALKALGERLRRKGWPSNEVIEGFDFLVPPYKDLIKVAWMNREKLPGDVLELVRARVAR